MPTEKKAIEKLGLNRDEIPVVKFRDTCKEFNKEYIKKQTEGFKRLGAIGDWENPYITYQPQMEAKQIGVFGNMYKKGYIYKGLKPVYWCTDCETALAEAEIEYKDIKSNTAYVKFPVIEGKGLFDERDTYVVIWTTTPWTLPGNTGITISPEFKYSLVDVQGEKLIMASELVDKVMEVAKIDDYSVIKEYEGNELEGVICKHPFIERESRVVLGSDDTILVELDTGTGAVHTAPGYGKEDYLCGLKNKLDMVVTVDSKGHQTEEAGPFAGMYYAKSDKEIIKYNAKRNNSRNDCLSLELLEKIDDLERRLKMLYEERKIEENKLTRISFLKTEKDIENKIKCINEEISNLKVKLASLKYDFDSLETGNYTYSDAGFIVDKRI